VARGIEGLLALASLDLAASTSCPDLTATLTTTAGRELRPKFGWHEPVVGTTGPTSMSAVPGTRHGADNPIRSRSVRKGGRFVSNGTLAAA
jgi:hypothetical protein